MRVVPLADRPYFAETLARWHHDEWRWLYQDWSFEACLAELRSHDDPDRVPTTLVAVSDEDELLGSVSLVVDDLPGFEHLSPWLASLFVRSERRGEGIGGRLLEAAVAQARRLGVQRLYLFTPGQEEYYAWRGWSVVERVSAGGQPVVIMSRLTADADQGGGRSCEPCSPCPC
jgi:predicted N-acetyltransferase YhbS